MKNKLDLSFIRAVLAALILASTIIFSTVSVEAAGWGKDGESWFYTYEDGTRYKNQWVYEDGWYYFGDDTYMVTGLQTVQSHTYYFCESDHGSWKKGRMMTGWQLIDGSYKYFDSNGYLRDDVTTNTGSTKGIDVSQYQGNMDWNKVRSEGISFAFVRVGHGAHKLDPYFKKNMANASATGIKTGVYFYSTAQSVSESKRDAQWVINQLQGYNVSYPVAIDLEDKSQTSLGKQTITDMAKAFCNEIKSAGYTPMVYCNENWAKNYVDFTQLDGVYRWIARYNGTYNENISRHIWQAGSTTFIDGINVNSVDIDFGYTDFTTIVTPRTKYVDGYTMNTGEWMHSAGGWWYDKGDGSYPANEWFYDGGKWYYFNSSGYLATGWLKSSAGWYYMSDKGMLEKQWFQSGGAWYYLQSGGLMATGWVKIDNIWFSFTSSGAMQSGWIQSSSSGNWFYLSNNGMLEKQWFQSGGAWYYLQSGGVMATGWQEIEGKWYYFNSSGAMAKSTTIDGYTLGADGAWVN